VLGEDDANPPLDAGNNQLTVTKEAMGTCFLGDLRLDPTLRRIQLPPEVNTE